MKPSKVAMIKGAGMVASLALITASMSNSSTCAMIFHQPIAPAKLKELKKN